MDKIRGVNLGGWFVLEQWMKPTLFEGITDPPDETVFCIKKPDAKKVLEDHWATFITESDFAYLASLGINSVRLPIPWWYMGEAPYHNSKKWIEHAMGLAAAHHISVLIDLHTAPGCQNGFDNGGIQGQINWPKDPKYIQLTVEKLVQITKDCMKYPSFWGIQVLNEPHWTIDLPFLQDFYEDAYHAIRKVNKEVYIVFHDGFRPTDGSWEPFFQQHAFDKVVFDLHLYHCFDPKLHQSKIEGHIDLLLNERKAMIEQLSKYVKVVVGEWSLGLHAHVLEHEDEFEQHLILSMLASAQLYAYEKGFGWYFWSYKIERDNHYGWDFSRLVKSGVMPNKY